MTVQTEPSVPLHIKRASRSLWAAIIGVPLLWALHLQVNYAIVPALCPNRRLWISHLITAVCLVLTLIGFLIAHRQWRELKEGTSDLAVEKFLAGLGLMTSTFFFIVIAATGVAAFFFEP